MRRHAPHIGRLNNTRAKNNDKEECSAHIICACRWHNQNAWRQIWSRTTEDFPWLLELITCACDRNETSTDPNRLIQMRSIFSAFGIYQATFTSPFCERIAFLRGDCCETRADSHYQTAIIYFSPALLLVLFLPPDGTGERGARWNYLRLQAAFCSRKVCAASKARSVHSFITSGSPLHLGERLEIVFQFPSHHIILWMVMRSGFASISALWFPSSHMAKFSKSGQIFLYPRQDFLSQLPTACFFTFASGTK